MAEDSLLGIEPESLPKNSSFIREGTKGEIEDHKKKILKLVEWLGPDKIDRERSYAMRRDFYEGKSDKYTNIIGLTRKAKRGHANAVFNYAGRTALKIYFALANNPPKVKLLPIPVADKFADSEVARAQAVEDMIDNILHTRNKFWHLAYPRSIINQVVYANAAIKVTMDFTGGKKEIKIFTKEKMQDLLVVWRGDDAQSYDAVIDTQLISVDYVERMYGFKPKETITYESGGAQGGHETGGEYLTQSQSGANVLQPEVRHRIPMVKQIIFDDETWNVIIIGDRVVQRVKHDWGFNPWEIVRNIHNPGKPWDIADIDYLTDPQVELNEASNDERDFIRVGANQKYKVVNMPDFDPESIKTGSGQVIFVEGEGADFAPIPVMVNTFPSGQYLSRVQRHIHDLGLPSVSFGASTAVSGRKAAIDFQSAGDVIDDKRRAWELALQGICEKIQRLLWTYWPSDIFKNPDTGEYEARLVEFDWADILPITQSDKIVDVLNKYQAGLISWQSALEELGYKDPMREIERMKREYADPEIASIKSKHVEILKGLIKQQLEARKAMAAAEEATAPQPTPEEMMGMPQEAGGGANVAAPIQLAEQNQERKRPMAQKAGTIRFTTPGGMIEQAKQNMKAQGG